MNFLKKIWLITLGEAEYIYDMPIVGGDLYGAFVIAKLGPAVLDNLDPSEALVSYKEFESDLTVELLVNNLFR